MDFRKHTRGGHFGHFLHWFAGEFAKRFDEVYVVTPKPRLTREMFRDSGDIPSNISFHRIPRSLKKGFDLTALRDVGSARRRNLYVFIMWGYDLPELPPPTEEDPPVPWATFGGFSWLRRGHSTPMAVKEEQMQTLYRSTPSCRAFLQSDQYLADVTGKAVWMPDVENIARPKHTTALAQRIRAHGAGRFCVGAFGAIRGYRCLNEMLLLAKAQPDIRFVVAGQVEEESVSPELLPLLREGALPNFLVLPGYIPTEEEMNEAIAATDAVFIDGNGYPMQSGIVLKAVEWGLCAVCPRSNSWTNDFVMEWGVGILYDSRSDPLVEAWARWKAEGGEARSRAASSFVRNPAALAVCFDRVSCELTKPWELSKQ